MRTNTRMLAAVFALAVMTIQFSACKKNDWAANSSGAISDAIENTDSSSR